MLIFVTIIAAVAYLAYRIGATLDRRRRGRRALATRRRIVGRTVIRGDIVPRDPTRHGVAARRASPPPPAASPPAPEPGTLEAVFERIDALLRGER